MKTRDRAIHSQEPHLYHMISMFSFSGNFYDGWLVVLVIIILSSIRPNIHNYNLLFETTINLLKTQKS